MSISFTVRTDCHVHDKAPHSRVDDYLETCIDKLRQIGRFASKNECDAVIDNGDFFHAKSASKNSHEMVRKVADLHNEEYDCPVYENPGNHDFPYSNVKYVERQPLGVLFSTGMFERLTDETFEDGDLKVRVVGFPYKSEFDLLEFDAERGDEDVLIAAAHTYASPEGGSIFGDEYALSYYDLAECSPDLFIFGHWHIDQGIQEVNGTTFMNLGSMTRGSLTEDNIERTPRFGHIEISKSTEGVVDIETDAIELDVHPAEDVFDLDRRDRLEEERREIDEFVSSLTASAEEDESDDILDTIRNSTEFKESVREEAVRYLQKVMND